MPSRWIDLPMTAICPLPENKMEAYFTFLEKKVDFDLRVTVGDKQIRFFHYMKRLPATRRVKFTKKNNII